MLKNQVSYASNEELRLEAILSLCDQGYSLHPDTLLFYSTKAAQLANALSKIDMRLKAEYYTSFALTNKGLIDSSLNVANRCLDQLPSSSAYTLLKADLYNQKGRCYVRMNRYKDAIEMGYKVIESGEQAKDTLMQMKGKTLIGWAYLEMGQPKIALTWHLRALHTTNNQLLLEKYGILFANLALNYSSFNKSDSSLYFIDKAIKYSQMHENLFALSNSLAIQAQLFVRQGKSRLAEGPLRRVVEIRKLVGDPFYIVSDMSQLSLYYAHNGQPEKGIALCNEGIAIAKKFGLETKLFFLYSTLAENYKAQGNTPKYAETLEKIIALKDSVYQKNSVEALAEMQTKYELQKKENLIILQKLDLSKKNYFIYAALLLLASASLIGWLLFRGYKKMQQIKMHKMQEEEKQLSAKAIMSAEENERRRIAADLHDSMGAYASAISANVDDMIMGNGSTDNSILRSMKTNASEIMTNLRDTIWVLNKDSILVTGISDRFKNYIQKFRDSFPNIRIEINESIIHDRSISPQNALNMLRIMQEAFHNAIKHSKGDLITINIDSNEHLKVSVTDNGIGISEEDAIGGHGFSNMQMRAKANGWKLAVTKLITGTCVELLA